MNNKKPRTGFEEHLEEDAGSSVPILLLKVPIQLESVKALADVNSSASMPVPNVSNKIFENCSPNQLVNVMEDADSSFPFPLHNVFDKILEYSSASVTSSAATDDGLLKVDQHTLVHPTLVNDLLKEEVAKKTKCYEPISLLGILGESKVSSWVREVEATLYIDSFVGHVPFVSSGSTGESLQTIQRSPDWVKDISDFLFEPTHFRVGRVVADDFSYSGTGWFYERFFVVTCAHVIEEIKKKNKEVLLQLPDNTLIDVEIMYSRPRDRMDLSYKMDIAILRMKQVHNTLPDSLDSLPIAAIPAGEPVWTSKCVTAGVLGTEAQNVLQKMLNVGRVESMSEVLTTVSARADVGFSGGPVLDRSARIIGMIQGGRGFEMKTVAIIPIEEVAKVIEVVSFSRPELPGLFLPMQIDSSTVPF
ncbi:hypothetical protein L7F22_011858 [Adiantum nelumboides]|nr:hypothetical protein [Adiantum nelumboides]